MQILIELDAVTYAHINENTEDSLDEGKAIEAIRKGMVFPETIKMQHPIHMNFDAMRDICKFYHVGIDQDHEAWPTCRYKPAIPAGCSWSPCNVEKCPLLVRVKEGETEQ